MRTSRGMGRALSLLVGTVVALATALGAAPSAVAAPPIAITYQILTLEGGQLAVLKGARVVAESWNYGTQTWVSQGVAETSGEYGRAEFTGSAYGLYRFTATKAGYPANVLYTQFTSSMTTFSALANMLPLPVGQASLVGTVLGPDGSPFASRTVTLTSRTATRSATTDADGTVTFSQVLPGEYEVSVGALSSAQGGPTRRTWYPGVANRRHATTVVVPETGTVTLDPWRLVAGGEITGRITASVPGQIGAAVRYFDADGEQVDYGSVSPDGQFSLVGLAPGTYTVRVDGEVRGASGTTSLIRQWYRDRYTLASARTITVRPGGVVRGVDVRLSDRLSAWQGPKISRRGKTLSVDPGRWSMVVGTTYSYAWRIGGRQAGTSRTARIPASVLKKARKGRKTAVQVTVLATDTLGRFAQGSATARFTVR